MSLDDTYKYAVKVERDYALREGRGKGWKVKATLYLKALIRIIKLTYRYRLIKNEKASVKRWLDLLDFLRRILSAVR